MESLILAVTMACALGTPTPVRAADEVKTTKAETRAEYLKKAHAELDELGAKIDALEIKAKAAGADAKAGLDEKLASLKTRRKTANKDYAKLKRASGKAWLSIKAGLDKGITELQEAYDAAAKD